MTNRRLSLVVFLTLLAATVWGQSVSLPDSLLFPDYRYYDKPVDPALYLIRPGEKLSVTFVGIKLAPITLHVGPEGKLVDRSLGVFDLADRSLAEVREMLQAPLGELYNCEQINISVGDPYRVAITVSGAVVNPGTYVLFSSQRVSEVISMAGGVKPEGSHRKIQLSGGPQQVLVDLDRADLVSDNSMNPCLYAGNTVFVPLRSSRLIHLVGAEARSIELLEDDTPDLLRRLAGGNGPDDGARLLVYRGEWRAAKGVELSPDDMIRLEYASPDSTVSIFGGVKKPGRYSYVQGLTLSGLIDQANGLKSAAIEDRTTVFRQLPPNEWGHRPQTKIPVTTGTGAKNAAIDLAPGDSILVPVSIGYVRVQGFVVTPGYYPYQAGRTAKDYVAMAGGWLEDADSKTVIVFNRVTSVSARASFDMEAGDGDIIRVIRREDIQ